MQRFILWSVLVATLTMLLAIPASAHHPLVSNSTSCKKTYTGKMIAVAARSVYRPFNAVTRAEERRLRYFRRCARSHQAGRRGLDAIYRWQKWRTRHRYDIFVSRLPYAGGGTRWAIPWYIVYCESGTSGLWSAYNSSGASGPYQLLGWGAPMPANTVDRKIAHHRIAASVWNGGAGRSNWVC